jgi:hypothetical protein
VNTPNKIKGQYVRFLYGLNSFHTSLDLNNHHGLDTGGALNVLGWLVNALSCVKWDSHLGIEKVLVGREVFIGLA